MTSDAVEGVGPAKIGLFEGIDGTAGAVTTGPG